MESEGMHSKKWLEESKERIKGILGNKQLNAFLVLALILMGERSLSSRPVPRTH